jgi:hypothetical protein
MYHHLQLRQVGMHVVQVYPFDTDPDPKMVWIRCLSLRVKHFSEKHVKSPMISEKSFLLSFRRKTKNIGRSLSDIF